LGSPILSLAILRVNWRERRKDYLDTLTPLIANLICSRGYDHVEVETLRSDFRQEFGLNIPYHAMVTLLNRAKKRGLLQQRYHTLYPIPDEVAALCSSDVVRDQTERYAAVIQQFVRFAKDHHGISLSEEAADSALIEFLRDHDLDILFAADQTSFIAEVRSPRQHRYVLYKFIEEAHRSQPQTFQYILDVVIGHALASTILYGQDKAFISGMRGTDVYLDTRLIFYLLGLEGTERKTQTVELLTLLTEQGARVLIFDHTRREVAQILDACIDWLNRGDYDPSKASRALRHMKESGFSSQDAERVAVNLNSLLEKCKVTMVRHPDPGANVGLQINEEELYQTIVSAYATRPEFNEESQRQSILIDVDSIAAVYRLRQGCSGRTIKDSHVVFATNNHTLARVARNFDEKQFGEDFRIPPAVTDVFIGTTAWLQAPAKADRINEQRLLAECYAGIRPDGVLLRKYVLEVEKLKKGDQISDEEYYTLRTHRVAMNLLAEKTLGDADAFTDRTSEEVLDEIRGQIQAEASGQYREEAARHQETRSQLERAELERDTLLKGLETRADTWAAISSLLLIVLVSGLFIGGIVVQFVPGIFQGFTAVRVLLLAFTTVLGGLSVGTGFNIKGLRVHVRGYLRQRILRIVGSG